MPIRMPSHASPAIHSLLGMLRNRCTGSIVTTARDRLEQLLGISRCGHLGRLAWLAAAAQDVRVPASKISAIQYTIAGARHENSGRSPCVCMAFSGNRSVAVARALIAQRLQPGKGLLLGVVGSSGFTLDRIGVLTV